MVKVHLTTSMESVSSIILCRPRVHLNFCLEIDASTFNLTCADDGSVNAYVYVLLLIPLCVVGFSIFLTQFKSHS